MEYISRTTTMLVYIVEWDCLIAQKPHFFSTLMLRTTVTLLEFYFCTYCNTINSFDLSSQELTQECLSFSTEVSIQRTVTTVARMKLY